MEIVTLILVSIVLLISLVILILNLINKNKDINQNTNNNDLNELYIKIIEKLNSEYQKINDSLNKNNIESITKLNEQIINMNKILSELLDNNFDKNSKELLELKENVSKLLIENKEKLNTSFNDLNISLIKQLNNTNEQIIKKLSDFQEHVNKNLNENIDKINTKVDEKLNDGFKKTNETFNNVLERLTKIDQAQKEIESLSKNVVSLQDILQDKKARGTFGEVQLENIIENIFGVNNTKIYERQYKLSNNTLCDMVIKLPSPINLLCIDSKFPLENYQKLIDRNIPENERNVYAKNFKNDCKKHIDDIRKKYIIEGETSDYAIMFIPAEAIFAEIYAYHQDVIDYSNNNKVLIAGPTTVMATLSSIQIGLRDLERDKQSKIVNENLKALGVEFSRFKDRWDKLKRNIDTVSKQASEVYTTSEKISGKFLKISNVDEETLIPNVEEIN
jgi:DNA recombination protein RmuC